MKKNIWMKAITGLFVVGLLAATLTGCGSKRNVEESEDQENTEMTEDMESSSEE